MPVEEGTGLHAFDNLDPVSTVSALSAMPEPEPEPSSARLVPPPRSTVPPPMARRSAPPPPPRAIGVLPSAPGSANGKAGVLAPIAPPLPSAARTSAPPPPPTGRKSSMAPPMPRGGVGVRSVPPAPPRLAQSEEPDEASIETRGEADEDTRVVPNAFAHDPEFAPTSAFARAPDESGEGAFEAFDGSDSAETQVSHERTAASQERAEATAGSPPRSGNGIDDTALLELAATTSATPIDMEWDEEEVQTKLRDGGSNPDVPKAAAHPLPYVGAQPSPFPPSSATARAIAGNPSPFGAPPTGFAPVAANAREWEDEDEAMTRVMAHGSVSGAPPAVSGSGNWTPAVGVRPWAGGETLAGDAPGERPLLSNRLAWVGFAAVALIAFTVVARALNAGRQPATVTVVTKPADALLTVDGQPRTGESSPFTLPNLEPGVDHTIDVSKQGFATASHHFRVKAGEIKPLPSIELSAMRVDTGFALTSLPGGASVYVDGRKLDQVTPIRIGDLAQGLHVVRLEYGNAYQPWETQVALAAGQVIELPTARLMPAGPSAHPQLIGAGTPSDAAGTRQDRKSPDAPSGGHHHHSEVHERAPMPQPAMHASMPAVRPSAPTPAFGGFGSGGGSGSQGTLRINSRPWSQVFVDGRMIGNTPQLNLALSPGHHNVKLVNPQLGMSKGFGVDIRAGKVATKIVDLQ